MLKIKMVFSWRHAAISILIPILAVCIQSAWVAWRGLRLRQALLWEPFNHSLWIVIGVQAIITYLVLWPFLKHPFLCRIILICLCAIWTYFAILQEAVAF